MAHAQGAADGIARHEFEYDLPSSDAEALWALAPHRLVKTRYALALPGSDWVLDCFEGENAPLVLAEVELPDAGAPLVLPDWCAEEMPEMVAGAMRPPVCKPISQWSSATRQRYGGIWHDLIRIFALARVFRFPLGFAWDQ